MNEQTLQLALMVLNGLLQRAAEISSRIKAGDLDLDGLRQLVEADDKARADQIEALARAKAEGR